MDSWNFSATLVDSLEWDVPKLKSPTKLDYLLKPIQEIKNIGLYAYIEDLFPILKETGAVIAGGFVRYLIAGGHMPSDIDIFTFNDEQVTEVCKLLTNQGFSRKNNTEFAVSFQKLLPVEEVGECLYTQSHKKVPGIIQVVKPFKLAKTPRELVDQFDFLICKCWLNGDWNVFVHPEFKYFEDRKMLKTEDNGVPLHTIQRMFKYYKYGYNVPIEDLVAIMDNFAKLSPADRDKAIVRAVNVMYHNVGE